MNGAECDTVVLLAGAAWALPAQPQTPVSRGKYPGRHDAATALFANDLQDTATDGFQDRVFGGRG